MTISGVSSLNCLFDPSQFLQKRSAVQNSGGPLTGASDADSVIITSGRQNIAAMVEAASKPGGSWAGYNTLTAADKKLVKDVTGWDINADPYGKTASTEAQKLAGRLNLDRFSGDSGDAQNGLVGEVNQAYISKLIQEQVSGQDIMPLSLLYKVQSYLAGQPNGTTQA